jgi:DNA-binding NarL/FixJ family response regulator
VISVHDEPIYLARAAAAGAAGYIAKTQLVPELLPALENIIGAPVLHAASAVSTARQLA